MLQVQVIRADLDEIVFEHREKGYGGYVLRKNYHKYLIFALFIMVSITALGVVAPFIYAKIQQITKEGLKKEVIITLDDLPKAKEKEMPVDAPLPPPPPPPKVDIQAEMPQKVEQVAVKTPIPKPPDDIQEEKPIMAQEDMEGKKAGLENVDGEKPTNENVPTLPNAEPHGTGKEPIVIQEPPILPATTKPTTPEDNSGKEPSPTEFIPAKQPKEVNLNDIQKLIGYPAAARELNLEAKIVVRVLIDENGNYMRHLPPKAGHPIFIKAIEEHISKVKFTPAVQGNKPIKFWVNVPFVFQLQ